MYKFSKKIENVYTCFANGHNSLIVVDKRIILLDDEIIFEGGEYTSADFCSNNFFRFGDIKNHFLGNILNKVIEKIDYSFGSNVISSKGVIATKNYRYDESDGKVKGDYYYLNYITKTEKLLLKDSEWHFVLTFDGEKKVILRKLNIFKSLSLETGAYFWEVSLNAYGYQDSHLGYVEANIRQIIGVSGDVLVVFMFSGALVGIDVQTGAIAWDIPFSKNYYPSDYQGNGWYWHLEGSYLYLFQHRYFLRIDLQTQKLEVLWQGAAEIDIEDCSYSEDFIYFMAINSDVSIIQPCVLGVFDRKKLEIVWQYNKIIGSSRPPQSDGSKLYCLDNAGVLHIFEREKTA